MNWGSFGEFVEMGGYGLYVWGSYLMAAAALAWEWAMLAHGSARALDNAREQALLRGGRR